MMPTLILDVGIIRHDVKATVTAIFDDIRENILVIKEKVGNLREIETMKRTKYKNQKIYLKRKPHLAEWVSQLGGDKRERISESENICTGSTQFKEKKKKDLKKCTKPQGLWDNFKSSNGWYLEFQKARRASQKKRSRKKWKNG